VLPGRLLRPLRLSHAAASLAANGADPERQPPLVGATVLPEWELVSNRACLLSASAPHGGIRAILSQIVVNATHIHRLSGRPAWCLILPQDGGKRKRQRDKPCIDVLCLMRSGLRRGDSGQSFPGVVPREFEQQDCQLLLEL